MALPLMRKKKAPVSLATARAIRVFPTPGGPYSIIPRGGCKRRRQFINFWIMYVKVVANMN